MSKISIVVPLFNQLHLTKRFIEEVQGLSGDWQLVLVDNGSTDGTNKYITSRKDRRITVVTMPENVGFAKGCNAGFEKATGDHVLFLNNDVEIKEDFLIKYHDYIEENPTSLIGRELVEGNSLVSVGGKVYSYLNGWCLYGTRELFESVAEINYGEVFSSDFPHFFEDAWLCYQAVSLGYVLEQVDVDVAHIISGSSGDVNKLTMTKIGQHVFRMKVSTHQWRAKGGKRIVFYVPDVAYGFTESDYDGKGVGGAESALIFLAKELAKNPEFRVEIYNKTKTVGQYNGVYYYNLNQYVPEIADVFVLYRSYDDMVYETPAHLKIFWSCDQRTNDRYTWDSLVFPGVDLVVAISEFHKNYLAENYQVEAEKIVVLPLSTRLEDYEKRVSKIPGKSIFCSVPTRGLDNLFRVLPEIKRRVPSFHLVITSDFRLWGLKKANNAAFVEMFKDLDYVNFLGKIPRSELVKHQLESQLMTYPSNYDECFCISALECMAAGAVPVTLNTGAIGETVGDGGIVLSNSVTDEEYVDSVVSLLKNEKKRLDLEARSRQRALKFTWPSIAQEWTRLVMNTEEFMAKAKKATKQASPAKQKAAQAEKKPTKMAAPTHVHMAFKVPVQASVNGRPFPSDGLEAKEFDVPIEFADAVSQIVRDVYGDVEK